MMKFFEDLIDIHLFISQWKHQNQGHILIRVVVITSEDIYTPRDASTELLCPTTSRTYSF